MFPSEAFFCSIETTEAVKHFVYIVKQFMLKLLFQDAMDCKETSNLTQPLFVRKHVNLIHIILYAVIFFFLEYSSYCQRFMFYMNNLDPMSPGINMYNTNKSEVVLVLYFKGIFQ